MRAIDHRTSIYTEQSTHAKWAGLAFFVYSFFVFFGTSMPFPDLTPEVSTGTSTNRVNQLLTLLYLLSLVTLWGKQEQVIAFIKREKFLTLFMAWSLLSVVWSDHSTISLKRWIGLLGELIICLAALLHFRWSEVALRTFRVILSVYLPLTILSVIFVPEAIQWEFPAWRGLAATKNNLGQVTLFSIIIWLGIISYHKKQAINVVHYAMLGFAVIAYLGARSTTSFLVGTFLVSILGAFYLADMIKLGSFARFYVFVLLIGFVSIAAVITFGAPEVLASIFGFMGKDLTFTGRVDLWQSVLEMTEGKRLLGWGLGGFWVMDSQHLWPLFQEFVWIPNQAHQGYIDVYAQVGVVGLLLLFAMIFSYFRGLNQLKKKQMWKWLFLGILILNLQESVFFRPRHIGHFMFLFAYVGLFADLIKQKSGQL